MFQLQQKSMKHLKKVLRAVLVSCRQHSLFGPCLDSIKAACTFFALAVYNFCMNIALSVRQKGANIFFAIPLWYRYLSAIMFAAVLAAILVSGGTGIPGWIILAVTAFSFFYEEKWLFNKSSGKCSGRMGLFFLYKGPVFSAKEVKELRLELFRKGYLDQSMMVEDHKMPPGSQLRLILDLKNGESYLLDSVPFRKKEALENNAKTIAAFMNFELK